MAFGTEESVLFIEVSLIQGYPYREVQLYCVSVVYNDIMQAMIVSQCGRYLVAGGFDCKVRVFLTHSLERNYVYEAFTSSIRSLHMSQDQRSVKAPIYTLCLNTIFSLHICRYIFAGLSSGSVVVLATHYWLDL